MGSPKTPRGRGRPKLPLTDAERKARQREQTRAWQRENLKRVRFLARQRYARLKQEAP